MALLVVASLIFIPLPVSITTPRLHRAAMSLAPRDTLFQPLMQLGMVMCIVLTILDNKEIIYKYAN